MYTPCILFYILCRLFKFIVNKTIGKVEQYTNVSIQSIYINLVGKFVDIFAPIRKILMKEVSTSRFRIVAPHCIFILGEKDSSLAEIAFGSRKIFKCI